MTWSLTVEEPVCLHHSTWLTLAATLVTFKNMINTYMISKIKLFLEIWVLFLEKKKERKKEIKDKYKAVYKWISAMEHFLNDDAFQLHVIHCTFHVLIRTSVHMVIPYMTQTSVVASLKKNACSMFVYSCCLAAHNWYRHGKSASFMWRYFRSLDDIGYALP